MTIYSNFFIFAKYWMFLELANWFLYLFVYINIIAPRFLYYKNKDTEKIIDRIDKLSPEEIEYVIKGCILYNKVTHEKIISENINLKDLTKSEIINLVGFSLFGLETNNIILNMNYKKVLEVCDKLEKKIDFKFIDSDSNKYIYRKWGSNYIDFNFRPIVLQIPLRLTINILHYYFKYRLSFNYHTCKKTKISYLYKISDSNKKTIFFIHGFGFGYIPYIKTLYKLEKDYNLIIIIMPTISSYRYYDDLNYSYFPPLKEIRESIYNFLHKLEVNNITILSHSFGTYITEILRRDSRSIIFWIGCFKMTLHVENPLTRKYPVYQYLLDNLVNFLIYQCIYLKYVCYRIMFGPDFWIYNSAELDNSNVTMVLEKGDYVIPAELLYNKIKDHTKCLYINNDEALHGSILMDDKYYNQIIDTIED